jgi:F-box-like
MLSRCKCVSDLISGIRSKALLNLLMVVGQAVERTKFHHPRMSTLAVLPIELIWSIFSKLDPKFLLLTASAVCKEWHILARHEEVWAPKLSTVVGRWVRTFWLRLTWPTQPTPAIPSSAFLTSMHDTEPQPLWALSETWWFQTCGTDV